MKSVNRLIKAITILFLFISLVFAPLSRADDPPVCLGDLDGDFKVTAPDLAAFTTVFGYSVLTGSGAGDFDNDGDADGKDLAVLAADFGRTDCDLIVEALQARWTGFIETLEAGQVEAALDYFVEHQRPYLQELFTVFSDRLVAIYGRGISLVNISGDKALFSVIATTESLGSFHTQVVFVREDGQWRLWDLR